MNAETSNELQDLYRELVLDHARNPRNFGRLPEATHHADGINPLCGDKLSIYLCIDDGSEVADISFEGSGCAISIASASLMTETVQHLTVANANSCAESVSARLTGSGNPFGGQTDIDLSHLRALDGVRAHPTRIKCATLAWKALGAALQQSTSNVSTE